MRSALVALSAALILTLACQRAPRAPRHLLTQSGATLLEDDADPVQSSGARRLEASFQDRLRLLGVRAPLSARPGEQVELSLFFEVSKEVRSEPQIFVHGMAAGGDANLVGADHPPLGGKLAPAEWHVGDVLHDTFRLRVPDPFPSDGLVILVGLYEGKERWAVRQGPHDGKNRVEVARIAIEGGGGALPTLLVHKRRAPIVLDGSLDEADWQRAERAGPFISWDGTGRITRPTWVRAVWDEDNLWLAFECEDPDVHTPYTQRDDPLYESEAVEIFIDANGDKDVYVELQAAPNDVHFDAAFQGGARKNFDTSYNVAVETKTKLKGTLNDPTDHDEGWISEWRIPVADIRGATTLRAGDSWQVNFFRLERLRRGEKVFRTEASAWSTPLSGDFHKLDRFGTLRFVD
jgi:hypothetical protein